MFCTQGEYVTMSNGVFNFNFLVLLLSEILGGSQIYTRGPYAPWTPPNAEIFVLEAITSQYIIVFLISSYELCAEMSSAAYQPPSGEIFLPKASTSQYLIVFLISTF